MFNKVYRKNVTDEELETLMAQHILELMSRVVPRKAIEEEKKENSSAGNKKDSGGLSLEKIEYMESIIEYPNLSITARAEKLGLSSCKNSQIKKKLLALGLIEEFSVNLGYEARGNVKFLLLTEKGYEVFWKKPEIKRPLNCSAEHFWWQGNIKKFYEGKGYQAKIEMALNGKCADVGIAKDGKFLAIEIELTPKNAVVNVQKDLEAGFDKVLSACKNAKVKKSVEEKLVQALTAADLGKVKQILLSDFQFVREIVKGTRN